MAWKIGSARVPVIRAIAVDRRLTITM